MHCVIKEMNIFAHYNGKKSSYSELLYHLLSF